jgi:raffinose/stachyose/melibiose transport system substrate-binding protein
LSPLKAATAIGVAALTMAGSTYTTSAFASSAPVTLKIITWVNPPAVQAFKQIDAEFQKANPNITVDLQTAANTTTGYATLEETSVDANSADIVTNVTQIQPLPLAATRANESDVQYWGTNNAFLSLNGQPFLKDFTNSALQTETYKGNVYGILSGVYQEMIFYNKADFAKYHVSVPTTYSQFITLCKTLQADHVSPIYFGIGSGASIYVERFLDEALMGELWLRHVPGEALATDIENGSVSWNSPYFVQAMTEEANIAKYFEPDYTGVSWESMPGAFADNKAPMLLDGSWDLSSVQQANPKIQVGSFPLPGSNVASQNEAVANPDLTIEILAKAPEKAAALKWLAFFASSKIYGQYVDTTGISPSETSGTYSSFSSKALGSLFGTGYNAGIVMPTLAPTEGYYDTPTEWPLLQEAVMAGSQTPQAAAKLYASDWKKQ